MKRRSRELALGVLLLCAACAPTHIMRVGRLRDPITLDNPAVSFQVRYIKAGGRWTNVWVDLVASAKGADVPFDPNDFELFDPQSNLSYKPTLQTFVSAVGMYGAMIAGGRDDGFGIGVTQATPPMVIHAGTTVPITLVFGTAQGGVKSITAADLVYRGQHLPFRAAAR